MFKRLVIGLFALSLVAIWLSEANARDSRYRRTVENFHECLEYFPGTSTPDPCYGATSVTDKLYGAILVDETVYATCQMEGRLFCDPVANDEICTDSDNQVPLTTVSFSADATFDVATAEDLTVLDPVVGQAACDSAYGAGSTVFRKFWPNSFVAHSVYLGSFANIPGTPSTYELIEYCVINPYDPLYDCTLMWDSTSGDDPPHLPCCGEINTITADVAPPLAGTVISDPEGIYCDGTDGSDCTETYDGTVSPFDGCPVELALTAAPVCDAPYGSCYEFTEWTGDVCSGSTDLTCTTTAEGSPTVTANFEASCYSLSVTLLDADANDRVRIFKPKDLTFDDPPGEDTCASDDSPCYLCAEPGTKVTVKKQGDNIEWGCACEGVPNSRDQCTVELTGSTEICVTFF